MLKFKNNFESKYYKKKSELHKPLYLTILI